MRERRLPRLGLLGLMTDGYEPLFPGITARQEAYARESVYDLADVAEIYFPGAAMNRAEIESKVRDMNSRDLDGMLIILLTYSQGSWLVRALQENHLPLGFAVVQPDQTVGDDWDELMLTVAPSNGAPPALASVTVPLILAAAYSISALTVATSSLLNFPATIVTLTV